MKNNKFACVIVNYNDAETTIDLVNRIYGYNNIGLIIIIVDNNSTDGSTLNIKKIVREEVILLELPYNGGYGYGNNQGIKYAQKCGFRYIVISNPDVYFSDNVLKKMLNYFYKN